MTGTPRDLVHMVSGKPVQGGIAYVNVLCNASFGYGVSQVFGSFDLAMPSQIWDVEVFAHELGHEFGSPHTHCYSPPVDMCYNMEAGCYSGAVVPSQGTIMSYCHLNAGGLANISLVFGGTVSARIGTSIAAASCLSTVTTTSTSLTTTSTSVPSTTSTSVTTTTSTSITTTTSTSVTTTTSSSTTSTCTSSTTSTSSTSTTSTSSTSTSLSTTSTTSSSTTSTTAPDVGGADGDEDDDGVPDVIDHCAGTPAGDLHDASGCSECPCAGPAGSGWASRGAYQRCVRDAVKRRLVARVFSANDKRAGMQHAKQSSCGRPGRTRCCVDPGACRIVTPAICDARGGSDVGAGSCRPSPCE
jgi:metallopeptidase family M12-like protein